MTDLSHPLRSDAAQAPRSAATRSDRLWTLAGVIVAALTLLPVLSLALLAAQPTIPGSAGLGVACAHDAAGPGEKLSASTSRSGSPAPSATASISSSRCGAARLASSTCCGSGPGSAPSAAAAR